MAGDLSTVDPVAIVVQYLRTHAGVLAAFGAPENISSVVEAPWPHLRVTDGEGGDMRDLRWTADYEVMFECYGAPLGKTGEVETRRLLMVAIEAVKELEDADQPSGPVVARVEPSGVAVRNPQDNGQYKFTFGLHLTIHPAAA